MRKLGRELEAPELNVGAAFVCCDQLNRCLLWNLSGNFCEEHGAVIGAADVLAQRVLTVYDLSFPPLALFKHNVAARCLGRFEHGNLLLGSFSFRTAALGQLCLVWE